MQCDLAFFIQKVTSAVDEGQLQEEIEIKPTKIENVTQYASPNETVYAIVDATNSSSKALYVDSNSTKMLHDYFHSTWNSRGFWLHGEEYARGLTLDMVNGSSYFFNYWDRLSEVLYYSDDIQKNFANLACADGFAAKDIDALTPLPYRCPSSVCNWDPSNSLAVCSACDDVTSSLTQSTRETDEGKYVAPTYKNASLQNLLDPVNPNDMTDAFLFNFSVPLSDQELIVPPSKLGFSTFYFINVTDLPTLSSWPNTSVRAEQCYLCFCIQETSSALQNNTLTETSQVVSADFSGFDQNCEPYHECQFVDPRNRTEVFEVTMDELSTLYTTINSTWGPEGLLGKHHYANYALDPSRNGSGRVSIEDDPARHLYQSKNLSNTFSNVATAMTRALHQYGTTEVTGQKSVAVTVISVRWLWTILPVGTVVLGGVFVFVTAWISARSETPPWKADVAAVLFYGLEQGPTADSCAKITSNVAMEKITKSISIRLDREVDGRATLAVDDSSLAKEGFLSGRTEKCYVTESMSSFTAHLKSSEEH